ncbi:MAG TPA: dTDP-4-dehydrorhamnose 3,5-epimerase [Bdellovibrionota bacterium]|nr:dTDP-4-dehydrorhamnose 3,5-epimerase [Bdellovibrionota bacterium]
MKFKKTTLDGLWSISPEPRVDDRGFFARTFCAKEFSENGLENRLVQTNLSYNNKRGLIRGLHYQSEPYEEAKCVSCVRGAIFDVAVDLRPGSRTYLHWYGVDLDAEQSNMLYVPKGFAHGFQTLQNDALVLYYISEFYRPELQRGIPWNDATLKISWPIPNPTLSDRDRNFSPLQP